MSNETTLTDAELMQAVNEWNNKLAKTGGHAWCLSVPVNFNRDPDMLISELLKRFAKYAIIVKQAELKTLKEENNEPSNIS